MADKTITLFHKKTLGWDEIMIWKHRFTSKLRIEVIEGNSGGSRMPLKVQSLK